MAGAASAQGVAQPIKPHGEGKNPGGPQGERYAGVTLTCEPSASGQSYSCRRERPSEPLDFEAHARRWLFRTGRDPIAVFTVGLFILGGWQLEVARRSAKRQLRAYLSVTPQSVARFAAGQKPQVQCVTRNHGQTPAYKIRHTFEISILQTMPPLPLEFPRPQHRIEDDTTLFPGEMTSFFNKSEPLTADEIKLVSKGEAALHIWGQTTYRDAFGRKRFTEFSGFAGGPEFAKTVQAAKIGQPGPGFGWTYGKRHGHSD